MLLLAAQGSLFRQPLMDFIIGNPLSVVAVQDGVTWVVWLVMCAVAALTYDGLTERPGSNHTLQRTAAGQEAASDHHA